MEHLEALSLLGEQRAARLDPATGAALRAHLAACPDCAAVAERWDDRPAPDLSARVLARVLTPRRRAWGWPEPAFALGLAASALLLGLAFWRPEAAWLRSDAALTCAAEVLKGGL